MAGNYYPIVFDGNGTGFSVKNTGTAPAPCVITVIPRVNLVRVMIEGLSKEPIVISNLTANDVVVINGEERTFTINNEPAWEQYDGWQFPRILPGDNSVVVSNGSQMAIEIAYNARYI